MRWHGFELDERGWVTKLADAPHAGDEIVEAMPLTSGLTVRVLTYGPRGGERVMHTGTLAELRHRRRLLDEAIEFGELVEQARQEWLTTLGREERR